MKFPINRRKKGLRGPLLLPNEILIEICSYIERRKDKQSVRLTCKAFADAMLPSLVGASRTVHISHYWPSLHKLQALSQVDALRYRFKRLQLNCALLDESKVGNLDGQSGWDEWWEESCVKEPRFHKHDKLGTREATYHQYCKLVGSRITNGEMALGT